jgi:hypothetical protein
MVRRRLKISEDKTLKKNESQWTYVNVLLLALAFDAGKDVMLFFPAIAFELLSLITIFGVILLCIFVLFTWVHNRVKKEVQHNE